MSHNTIVTLNENRLRLDPHDAIEEKLFWIWKRFGLQFAPEYKEFSSRILIASYSGPVIDTPDFLSIGRQSLVNTSSCKGISLTPQDARQDFLPEYRWAVRSGYQSAFASGNISLQEIDADVCNKTRVKRSTYRRSIYPVTIGRPAFIVYCSKLHT